MSSLGPPFISPLNIKQHMTLRKMFETESCFRDFTDGPDGPDDHDNPDDQLLFTDVFPKYVSTKV